MLPVRPRRRPLVGLALAALVVAGCGDAGDDATIEGGSSTATTDPAPSSTTSTSTAVTPSTSIPTEITATSAPGGPPPVVDAEDVTWDLTAVGFRADLGRRIAYACPPGGGPRPVWGTAVYTDDSSVCAAAVHAGLIGLGGGRVVIEVRAGQDTYAASVANGIVSEDHGPWGASFTFPEA